MPSESFRQRAWNCALLTITVVCVCVVVLCGVMIVREYSLASNYEPATCRVTNITYTRDMLCTFCESKDKTKEPGASACIQTKLPCIHIGVRYAVGGSQREAQLHPDSLQAAGAYSQCSFSICLKFYEDNKKAVADFAKPWSARQKSGKTFSCFYNTKDHGTIIVAKMHTKSDVIHSMLWPGLVILICGVIFLRLEMKRRGMGFCDINQMPGAPGGGATGSATGGKPNMVRNGGSSGALQPDAKQTLLRVENDARPENVECLLMKSPAGGLSSSMPGLDKLKPASASAVDGGRPKSSNPTTTRNPWSDADDGRRSSLGVDGLRLQRIRSAEETSGATNVGATNTPSSNPLLLSALPKGRDDGSKTDCASSFTGSQGSKVMGLETPV